MNNIIDLKEDHKALLFKHLEFFKAKKEKLKKEITMTVEDYKSSQYK